MKASEILNKGGFLDLLAMLEGRELTTHLEIRDAAVKHGAPKSCTSCRHLCTHDGCGEYGTSKYCLNDKGQEDYINHEFGNYWQDEADSYLSGRRNIVIGYQGEAEVNANGGMKEAYKHLRHVSEECGYLTTKSGNVITVFKDTGEHQLIYDEPGELQSVGKVNEAREFTSEWSRSAGAL